MKFSASEIKELAGNGLIEINVDDSHVYDWLDIVAIPPRPTGDFSNLYFTTYSVGEGGWDYGFDRRPIARQVAKDKNWHLCPDPKIDSIEETSHIMVASLNELICSLYNQARTETNPYIVGVTGSVGKTTIVAFFGAYRKHCQN